ncbi:MAG: phage tail tape measure protein [Patescibacteria group bacterium]
MNIETFITYRARVDEGDLQKAKQDIKRATVDMEKSVGGRGQEQEVQKQTGAYKDLSQQVNRHLAIIKEYERIDKTGRLGQTERLKLVRNLTAAKADGIKLENLSTESGKKLNTVLDEQSGAYTKLQAASQRTLLTIMKWAVGWTAAYSVMRAGINLMRSSISNMLEMEEGIARAVSASRMGRGNIMTAKEARDIKQLYTKELLYLMRDTSASYKDASTALYQLASAGLTAKEAVSALEPVLDMSVATFGDLEQGARLTASIYNVFGDQFTKFASKREAFTHISDVIVTAYNQEQIELSELSSALEYVANTAGKVDISFEELVATIGFLGSGMLRGSKAGTDLMNFFSDVIKKADLIKEKLDITIDPKKPFNPIKFMEDLHEKAEQNKVTLATLFDIFGQRGRKGVMEILNRWEEWQRVIKQTNNEMAGATKRTKELVEDATIKQVKELRNAWDSLLGTMRNTASVFGILDFLQNYINNLSRGFEILYEAKRNLEMFSELAPSKNPLERMFSDNGVLKIRSYSKALANINQQIREMRLDPEVEKRAMLRGESLLRAKIPFETIIDKSDLYDILGKVEKEIQTNAKKIKIPVEVKPKKFLAGETGTAEADKEKDAAKQWRYELELLRNALSLINNEIEIQNTLMRAYGVDESALVENNIRGLNAEIKLLQEKQKTVADIDNRRDIESQIFEKGLQLKREEANLAATSIAQQKEAYLDLFKTNETAINHQIEMRKLEYQIQGRSQEEILGLETELANQKQAGIEGQLGLNALLQSTLILYKGLSKEEIEQRVNQLIELGYTKERVLLQLQLLDVEKRRAEILEDFANQESINVSLGYTDLQVKRMQLATINEIISKTDKENSVQLELLGKEKDGLLTGIQISQNKERQEDISREILYLETGVTNLPRLLQSYLLEESLQKRLELAQSEGDILRANVLQQEIDKLQKDRAIEQLQTMQEVSGQISEEIYGLISGTKSWGDVMQSVNQTVLKASIEYLTKMLLQMLMMKAIGIFGGMGGGDSSGVGANTGDWNLPSTAFGANGAVWRGGFKAFAGGGIARQPTLGLIGEGKYNEAIVPLPDGKKIPVNLKGQEREQRPLNIINAIDPSFISAAIANDPNTVINIVNSDLLRNGMTRKVVRGGM